MSTNGGVEPQWRRNEIFYIRPDNMLMAVDVSGGATLSPGTPRPLFPTRPSCVLRFDAAKGGQRFLVLMPVDEAFGAPATVRLNWREARR